MSGTKRLRGIIFDMDGTLTKPQNYMFAEMRKALNITKSQDILKSIESLPPTDQEPAHDKIRKIERDAMAKMEPQGGLDELMTFLEATDLKKGICTRNFKDPVEYLLKTYLSQYTISPVLTREFLPPKPSPEPLLYICRNMGIEASDCLMVGDGGDDLIAAEKAGMDAILLQNSENVELIEKHTPKYVVNDLVEVIDIVRRRME